MDFWGVTMLKISRKQDVAFELLLILILGNEVSKLVFCTLLGGGGGGGGGGS